MVFNIILFILKYDNNLIVWQGRHIFCQKGSVSVRWYWENILKMLMSIMTSYFQFCSNWSKATTITFSSDNCDCMMRGICCKAFVNSFFFSNSRSPLNIFCIIHSRSFCNYWDSFVHYLTCKSFKMTLMKAIDIGSGSLETENVTMRLLPL